MRTRSPLFSRSTSTSLNGVFKRIGPAIYSSVRGAGRSFSYDCFFMSLRMTLNIDRERETGDMARHDQHVDSQGGNPAPQPLRSDTQVIDYRHNIRLQRLQFRIF